MNRRELAQVIAGTAIAHNLVSVLGCQAQSSSAASPASPQEPEAPSSNTGLGPSPADLALATSAAACVRAGETCLAHCIRSLSQGSTSLAACARAVEQMIAVCRATSSLAAMGSAYVTQLAEVCRLACSACSATCKPHASHHDECGACYEACEHTVELLLAYQR